MYNSVPTLPNDVKYNLVDIEGNENEHPFAKALDQLFGKQSSHTIFEAFIPFKCIMSSH